jgi:hypothetical protein
MEGKRMRPNDEQVRALAEFAESILSCACENVFFSEDDRALVVVAAAEAGILSVAHVSDGGMVVETLPDWLLEAAGQHTLGDASRE